MTRHAVSRIVSRIAHNCSEFGRYFMNVQSSNCSGCPNCRCEEGPSVEEAKIDYQAILRISSSSDIAYATN